MAKLSRLQSRLTTVQARIAELEAIYSDLAKYKSYAKGFGEVQVVYQRFGEVATEYTRLCREEDHLEDVIAELTDAENSGSAVAAFREVQ